MTGNASPLAATMADGPSLTGRAREAGLVRSPAPTVEDLVALALAQPDLSLCREAFHGALAAATSPAGLATALAEHLKGEADRHWLIDGHTSLRLADAMIALGELATEPRIVALGTMARADALRLLGDPRAALVLLDTAADLFQRCGDEVGWARTRISQMPALMFLGALDDALAVAARARPVLLAHNEVLRVARLDFNTAYAYEQLGRTAAALERYAIVAASCQDLGTPEAADLLVMTRVNQAIALTRQGKLSEALASLHEARTLFSRGDEALHVAKTDINIGFVSKFQGRYGPALRALQDARSAFERLAMPIEAVEVGWNILDCYLATGRPDRVLALAPALIDTCADHGLVLQRSQVALRQAAAYQQLGQPAAALESLTTSDSLVSEEMRARFAVGRARALISQGAGEASRVELAKALAVFETLGLPVEAAQTALLAAQALGPSSAARQAAQSALTAALALGIPWLMASAHALVATLDAAADDLPSATVGFAQAIAALDRMQQYMTAEMRRGFLSEDHEAIYRSAIIVALRRGQPAETFDLVERAKSRALLEHVGGGLQPRLRSDDPPARELVTRLAAAREEYQVCCAALSDWGSAQAAALLPSSPPHDLARQIAQCEDRMHGLIEALHLRSPAYDDEAGLHGARTLDPRPYLEPGHVLVSYYALDDDLLIVALDHAGISTTRLPGAWGGVCTDLRLLRLNIQRVVAAIHDGRARDVLPGLEHNARGLLRRLWDRLLGPVAHLIERATRVTIAPYGPLHYLPFQALHDGQRYLVQRVPVSVVPSASLLATLHRRANRRRAGPGDRPIRRGTSLVVGTTLRGTLPHIAPELAAIAAHLQGRVLLDEQATRAAVLAQAGQATVLHLATHGWLHPTDALFSYLQMSDARLSTADIMDLDLSCALVTLSACETGRGHLGGGDDLVGFSRAFLQAGADALILSLWQVEDRSTACLMDVLYASLAAGQAKDEALRVAQLALLTGATEPMALPTTHPYFWAPFVLVGDHRPLTIGER